LLSKNKHIREVLVPKRYVGGIFKRSDIEKAVREASAEYQSGKLKNVKPVEIKIVPNLS